ncbi:MULTISPECIES: hypothetical protein [Pseudonocardia]|uniref:ThiF family protein n=2 Tax=Pseudonocardia TaxID=1847 RepID=A0A1Y2N5U8_PSEAH|nr:MULTISPECIES: hypothetical protein [Pseudonocardia]OSY42529.1 hypothetical protein BG845_01449 [Pseudonocardia autotrophica]TDN76048.1 hypothetical protein C8E95_5234 [Pseudonocardia autotrophica]BBG00025.1 hypothetical protein Pdca_12340 [Pseudonocardia autotrophica]GEC28067.1 hypothetical protein PSA01_50960 [Pseudonocardia saturnea]
MSELPRRLALAPHHALVATGPCSRRIGNGPAGARLLDDLSPVATAALDRLAAGPCTVAELQADVPPGRRREALPVLLGVLLRAGLLVDPDLGERVRRRRESALVEVRGDSALAGAVVRGLAGSGIGHVHPRVTGTVDGADVATGLPATDGHRARALHDLLAAAGVRSGPAGRVPPDLLVLAGAPEAVPDDAVVQLVVTLRNGRGVVGPLLLPGGGPCRGCRDGGAEGDREIGVDTVVPGPRTAEPHVVAATAALAVAQALAALDGPVGGNPPPASWRTELELAADLASIGVHPIPGRPGCPCGAATIPVPVPGAIPVPIPATISGTAPMTTPTARCAAPRTGWTIVG